MVHPTSWLLGAIYPSHRWTVKTWTFSKEEIGALKGKALAGKKGEELKAMRLSTNDIITALFWKLRATLNPWTPWDDPILCTMVINTRGYLPERFPEEYVGNALAFLLLSKTRKELVER